MSKDEALKLALEALENHCGNYKLDDAGGKRWNKAVAAIKEALAQDELCSSQEPWMYRIWNDKDAQWRLTDDCSWPAEPIYTTPPNPKSQPEQEPVAIYRAGQAKGEPFHVGFFKALDADEVLLYTAPPAAQPEQEPVATTYKEVTDAMNLLLNGDYKQVQMAQLMADAKLYTTPPQRPWVGLTEEEANLLWENTDDTDSWELIKKIEAKLKELNT